MTFDDQAEALNKTLKPCANCGSEATVSTCCEVDFFVMCTDDTCGCSTQGFKTIEEAIAVWNNRTGKPLSLISSNEETDFKFGKKYRIEIQDLAANAFIEMSGKRYVSFRNLEEYAAAVVKELQKKGNTASLYLARYITHDFFITYSRFFKAETEGIKLQDNITESDLINSFRGYLPLDLLVAFVSDDAVRALK